MLTGHPPAKIFYSPQQGGLEIPLGRAAAEAVPMGGSSLPHVQLRNLEQALLSYDQSGVSLTETFLASLCTVLVVSLDQGITITGLSVADSLASAHARGSSQGGGGHHCLALFVSSWVSPVLRWTLSACILAEV